MTKPLCQYCGLEDGACICRHLPTDKERFTRLAKDKRAQIPSGLKAPPDFKPTRTLIADRVAKLKQE